MLTAEENSQIETAVRQLLAQPHVTPAEVAQLLVSLPQVREAYDRAISVARELQWRGVPLLEQAAARLNEAPPPAPVSSPSRKVFAPRRPSLPPTLAGAAQPTPLPGAGPTTVPVPPGGLGAIAAPPALPDTGTPLPEAAPPAAAAPGAPLTPEALHALLGSPAAFPQKVDALIIAVRTGQRSAVPVVRTHLASETNPFIVATFASFLGHLGDASDGERLVPLLRHTDARVIANALEALNRLGLQPPLGILSELVEAPDTRIRTNALALFGRTNLRQVLERLPALTEAPDVATRCGAAYLLGEMPDQPRARELLLQMLVVEERSPVLRRIAQSAKKLGSHPHARAMLGPLWELKQRVGGAKQALVSMLIQEIATGSGWVEEQVATAGRAYQAELRAGRAASGPPPRQNSGRARPLSAPGSRPDGALAPEDPATRPYDAPPPIAAAPAPAPESDGALESDPALPPASDVAPAEPPVAPVDAAPEAVSEAVSEAAPEAVSEAAPEAAPQAAPDAPHELAPTVGGSPEAPVSNPPASDSRTSSPGLRFPRTTGRFKTIVDSGPDLPPLKPGVDLAAQAVTSAQRSTARFKTIVDPGTDPAAPSLTATVAPDPVRPARITARYQTMVDSGSDPVLASPAPATPTLPRTTARFKTMTSTSSASNPVAPPPPPVTRSSVTQRIDVSALIQDESDAELPLSFSSVWGEQQAAGAAAARTTQKLAVIEGVSSRRSTKQAALAAAACVLIAAGGFALMPSGEPPAPELSRSQQLRASPKAPVFALAKKAIGSAPAAARGAFANGPAGTGTGPIASEEGRRPTGRAKPMPLPTALGPTGARVDVEGTVVASEPGRVIIKSSNRYYLIRGEELKGAVGSRFRARGTLTGVGHGGVVFVDTKA